MFLVNNVGNKALLLFKNSYFKSKFLNVSLFFIYSLIKENDFNVSILTFELKLEN